MKDQEGELSSLPATTWRLRLPLAGQVLASSARLDASDCNVAIWVTKAVGSEGLWPGLVSEVNASLE